MMRTLATVVVAVGLAALVGCSAPAGVDRVASPVGSWSGDGDTALTLTDDGTLTGSDGCNGIQGTWTTEGADITVTLGLQTLRGCPGIDTWLSQIRTAVVVGDQLVVSDRGGTRIGALQRVG